MESQLGTHVDFRVALASYFIQVHPKFQSPKIVEMHSFERAAYRDELTGLYNYRFFLDCLTHEVARFESAGPGIRESGGSASFGRAFYQGKLTTGDTLKRICQSGPNRSGDSR